MAKSTSGHKSQKKPKVRCKVKNIKYITLLVVFIVLPSIVVYAIKHIDLDMFTGIGYINLSEYYGWKLNEKQNTIIMDSANKHSQLLIIASKENDKILKIHANTDVCNVQGKSNISLDSAQVNKDCGTIIIDNLKFIQPKSKNNFHNLTISMDSFVKNQNESPYFNSKNNNAHAEFDLYYKTHTENVYSKIPDLKIYTPFDELSLAVSSIVKFLIVLLSILAIKPARFISTENVLNNSIEVFK